MYCSGVDSLKDQLEGVKHIVLYDYSPGRSAQAAKDFLGKYDGYLQTDAYAAYDSLTRVTSVAVWRMLVDTSWTRKKYKPKER